MDNARLIELVGKYPVLYDLSHNKYMDNNYKTRIWEEIGKQLNSSVSSCKTRWNNIRDNYRKSLRKMGGRSGQATKKVKTYKYGQILSFLRPFFEDIKPTEQITPSSPEHVTQDNITTDTEDMSNIEVAQNIPETDVRDPLQLSTPERILNYLENRKSPIDTFLSGIGMTLKTLPPLEQNLAKTEIFNIVQKYELTYLREREKAEHNNDDDRESFLQKYYSNLKP